MSNELNSASQTSSDNDSLLGPSCNYTMPPGQVDFVQLLLQEQQELTAVDRFVHKSYERDLARQTSSPIQETYYRALLPATAPNEHEQFAFEVDLDQCSGCKACVVACHTMNGLEDSESWREVGIVTLAEPDHADTEHLSSVAIQHVTTACHHCEDPGCLNGCPVIAYEKDYVTGIVRHFDDQCIGCKYCTMMCPYEVPKFSSRLGIVRKCDMCYHRLAVNEAPACVQSCPNEAIRIQLVQRTTPGSTSSTPIAPGAAPSDISHPTTKYRTQHAFADSVPGDQGLDHVADSHWPLAVMLVLTQVSVGMLLWERSVALTLWLTGDGLHFLTTAINAFCSLCLGTLGLGLASLHLGQPWKAWRVFLGLRKSWLSREAVFLGMHATFLTGANLLISGSALFGESQLYNSTAVPSNLTAANGGLMLLNISLVLGLVGLYCSAMIYVATRRPLWRAVRTFIPFAGTTIVGGTILATTVMVGVAVAQSKSSQTQSMLAAMAWILSAITLLCLALYQWRIQFGPPRLDDHTHDARRRKLTSKQLSLARYARLFSIWLSIVLCLVSCVASLSSELSSLIVVGLTFITALTVLVSEYIDRLIYFASIVYDRMPGTMR